MFWLIASEEFADPARSFTWPGTGASCLLQTSRRITGGISNSCSDTSAVTRLLPEIMINITIL